MDINSQTLQPKELSLAAFLQSAPHQVFLFVGSNPVPSFLATLPEAVEIPAADQSLGGCGWKSEDFWKSGRLAEMPLSPTHRPIAVFFDDPASIPDAAAADLRRRGFVAVLLNFSGQWRCVELPTLGSSAAITDAYERVKAGFQDRLLRLVLKYLARDLHAAGVQNYQPEQGHCYLAPLPQLTELSDSSAGIKEDLLFFEEAELLPAHRSHDEIRTQGRGACSLWNGHLYFSATDNSDPNANGRRYRYLDIRRGLPGRLRTFLSRPQCRRQMQNLSKMPSRPIPARLDSPRLARLVAGADENFRPQYDAANPNSVCLLVDDLGFGRAQQQAVELAIGLKSSGFSVVLQSCDSRTPGAQHYRPQLELHGILVEHLDQPSKAEDCSWTPSLNDALLLSSASPALIPVVLRAAARFSSLRPQIVHCFQCRAQTIGMLAALISGVPKVFLGLLTARPDFYPEQFDEFSRHLQRLLAGSRRMGLIADSKLVADGYSRWIGSAPSAVTVAEFRGGSAFDSELQRRERESLRRQLNLAADSIVVLYAGHFTQEKRPLRFIRLIYDLSKSFPEVMAVMSGSGPLLPFVKSEVANLGLENIIHIIEPVADIRRLFAASDLYVLTSADESVPGTLIEAQRCGLPAVAAEVGAVGDVVADGETGFVCAKNDYACLYRRTAELIADQSQRQKFSQQAAAVFAVDQGQWLSRTIEAYCLKAPGGSKNKTLCA